MAHFERAFYLSDLDTHGEAIKETLKSLELKPDNHDALLLTVRCYLALRDVEKSHQYAARSIKLFPEDYNVYRNMANIEMASGHVDKAVAVVQQGLKVLRQDPTLLWTLTNLLIDANRLKEAKETIAKLQAINYPRRFIALLNARTEMIQGHWLAACQGFEKVRGYLMAPGARDLLKYADLWIADCYSQLGNSDQQIATLRRSVKADPFFGLARASLADALLSAGNVDQAINESRDLIDLSHIGTPGLIAMVRILIQEIFGNPSAGRDWRPVEKMIDDAEKAMPDSVQILILRGELLVVQNRLADAEALLQKAKSKTPRQAEVWTTLIALAERRQDWPKTERLLEESQKLLGDTVELRLAQRNLSCGETTQKPSTAYKHWEKMSTVFLLLERTQALERPRGRCDADA